MRQWAPPDRIAAALAGEAGSAERLVSGVWPGCFRLAASVIGDRDLAEDAAQEACAVVYRKVRSLRSVDAFDSWLYRIVMRESSRVRRRHGVVAEQAIEPYAVNDETTSLDVWKALSALPPDFRDVTVLFYFDDLKTEEIATILRVAHATVRTRLARARERLRGLLDDYGNESQATDEGKKQYAF